MSSLFKKNSNYKRGKNILAFFTFQTWAFIISAILLILAIGSAYPVYMEGKTAQKNAEQSLEAFEMVVLKTEPSKSQNTAEIAESSNTAVIGTSQNIDEEEINSDEVQQLPSKAIEKPKVEYTPIAKLQAEKIGLNVSVLSEWSYELLDISVNKFNGPEPNEPGNFIVIGHNYSNGAHFGSLHLLEIGDLIDLTDLLGRKITYEVYEILTIKPDEIEKLMTDEVRTLTLVTCDTNNALRVVIKSKETN